MQFTPAELSILRQAAEIILKAQAPAKPQLPQRQFQDKRMTNKDTGEFGVTKPNVAHIACGCNVLPWEDCIHNKGNP